MRSRVSIALAGAGVVLVGGLAAAGPAAANTTQARAHAVRVLQLTAPRGLESPNRRGSKGSSSLGPLTLHSSAAQGAISNTPKVYLVFWGSQWGSSGAAGSGDPAGAANALQQFFGALYGAEDTWGTILNQYCSGLAVGTSNCGSAGVHVTHPSSTVLAGVWFDNAAAAPKGASTSQLATEAARAAANFGNATATSNYETQYVIATPSGAHPTGFGTSYCAWHSSASTTAGTIAYTNLPYVPDLGTGACTTLGSPTTLDGYFSTETHEYAETVTDLWPSKGWLNGKGSEIGDLCVNLDAVLTLTVPVNGVPTKFPFDVQGLWSNSANKCVTSGP